MGSRETSAFAFCGGPSFLLPNHFEIWRNWQATRNGGCESYEFHKCPLHFGASQSGNKQPGDFPVAPHATICPKEAGFQAWPGLALGALEASGTAVAVQGLSGSQKLTRARSQAGGKVGAANSSPNVGLEAPSVRGLQKIT